ncbi:metallophosphoesterase [Pseudanabaena sp. PCC 6802]|uniref:metallophosphoesterase n=1 Tax=Pseudanabaena sp. PCC 6802 TaxID=118173 RepID=UPI000349425D
MSMRRRQMLLLVGTGLGAAVAGGTIAKLISPGSESKSANSPDPQSSYTAKAENVSTRGNEQTPLLRFTAIADTGTGDFGQYAVADAMAKYYEAKPYPLVILAGDNIYPNGEIERVKSVFEEPYKPLLSKGVEFHAVLGNHDIITDNGVPQIEYKPFHMPDRYYTFRQGSVQFFGIDTNVNSPWKKQLAWLEESLAASDAPWKIVFGHHPIYSSGFYGNTQAFIDDLSPLFAKYNVQLYLCGHDHNYERSKDIKGTTYIVHGGGAHTRSVGKSATTAYAIAKRSFVALEVYEKRIVTEAIGTDGKVFDRGEILL